MKASVEMPGVAAEKGPAGGIDFDVATPGVIPAVGLRLAEGRDFTPADDAKAAPVAIVNRAFVRRYFPAQDGLGRIIPRAAGTKDLRIVGVLEDAKMRSLREAPEPLLLVPQAQLWFAGMSLVVRTATGSERSVEPSVRAAVASVDKDLGLFAPRTLREHVGQVLGKEKLVAALLSGFAALALLLASFGLFGVLSYAAESRRREIGVRIALGAEPADILRLVTSQGARVVALGLAAGALAALAASRVLAHLLFGVSPQDPLTLAAVAFVLAASALLASAVPAWRASRVDPITALRTE
jgi:predicted permease